MAGRRELDFASLDAVMPNVEGLLGGYTTVGRWSLGQICRHLSVALRLTTASQGRERRRVEETPATRAARARMLGSGRFPEAMEVPTEKLNPPTGLDDRGEAEGLRAALAEFAASPGPFADHPLLGPLTRQEWDRFHCIHCAHHLSFARPAENGA